ncbi:MAG: iron-containing alcohol dehydrogenase [Bacteroidales bacterium]|jgi:NADP-dependent alcohol dehydrogenase|nr:iron-containing alcohol dehydrogenase [Bacteroidales bacterium]
MNNFEFQNPTKVVFGKGSIAKLSELMYKGEKIMMTYGGGSIKKNGVYDQVMKALKGFSVIEFGGIEPNPDYDTLMKAVEICRKEGVGMLLAVGGGSVIDGTKLIAAAVDFKGDPWNDILVKGAEPGEVLPLASVLTMPATGSEMNCNAVISRRATKEKFAMGHPKYYPVFSILDPEVVYSIPKKQRANGLTDSFIHVFEQYLTDDINAKIQDRWAEGVFKTIVEIAPDVMADKPSYDACANYMWSATCALNFFICPGVNQDWSTHMIGHELTALCGLDHGVTLAIVLPGTMSVMREAKMKKLEMFCKNVWGVDAKGDEAVNVAIQKSESFFNSLGIKTRLSDYGIGEDVVNEIVRRFRERGAKLGEHGIVTPDKVEAILRDRL